MARLVPLQTEFLRMIRDLGRDELPKGSCWKISDYIPQLDAALTKRGGWEYGSANVSTAASGAVYLNSVAYAPFDSGAKLVAMTDNSKFVTISLADESVALVSTSGVQSRQRPVFHDNKLIIPAGNGTSAPLVYNGTTLANLGGSPPTGRYATVWKDFTVLGPTLAEPEKTYFSGAANPESWDTAVGWQGTLQDPTGYAALPNALMVFMEDSTARIRGSLPPPDSDFIIDDPIFQHGCTDARSIAIQGGFAIFASPLGVIKTNGTNLPEDLTLSAGLSRYWRSLFSGYDSDTWQIAGGFIQNLYKVAITNGATFVDSFFFDPKSGAGWQSSNDAVTMFAPAIGISEELYAADRTSPFVRKLSPIFTPLLNASDANNVPVAPILETPFYLDKRSGKKRWRNLYTEFDMRSANGASPTMSISYITNPGDAYTLLTPAEGAATNYDYSRIPLSQDAHGMGFRFAQTGASERTQFYGLLADVYAKEGSRVR